jgi:hypothetical protein
VADSADGVRRLARAAGIAATEGRSYDWAGIEAALGIGLPSDYKLIAESFPEGWFRMFAEVWLPDSGTRLLSDYAQAILDSVRELRLDEDFADLGFPFPAYPEPGGLLLCGSLRCPGYVFWLTGPGDPDEWPLVLAYEEYDYWERFDGPLSGFLTEVALGRFDASGFPDDFQWDGQDRIDILSRPVFEREQSAAAGAVSPPDTGPDHRKNILRVIEHPMAAGEMPALREMIGVPPAEAPAVDWDAVHSRLGLVLPSDYREFMDAYGPGTFGVIRIMAPGAPDEWNLFALLEQRCAQLQGAERYPPMDVPFYPEAGGVVSWGVTQDGRTLTWVPVGEDPDKWPVSLISANARRSVDRLNSRTSFSALLLYYAEHDESRDLLSMAYPEDVEVRFTPHR